MAETMERAQSPSVAAQKPDEIRLNSLHETVDHTRRQLQVASASQNISAMETAAHLALLKATSLGHGGSMDHLDSSIILLNEVMAMGPDLKYREMVAKVALPMAIAALDQARSPDNPEKIQNGYVTNMSLLCDMVLEGSPPGSSPRKSVFDLRMQAYEEVVAKTPIFYGLATDLLDKIADQVIHDSPALPTHNPRLDDIAFKAAVGLTRAHDDHMLISDPLSMGRTEPLPRAEVMKRAGADAATAAFAKILERTADSNSPLGQAARGAGQVAENAHNYHPSHGGHKPSELKALNDRVAGIKGILKTTSGAKLQLVS